MVLQFNEKLARDLVFKTFALHHKSVVLSTDMKLKTRDGERGRETKGSTLKLSYMM